MSTADGNTGGGFRALHDTVAGSAIASLNTAYGDSAMERNTEGGANSAFGASALQFCCGHTDNNGFGNVGIGFSALQLLKLGSDNVAVGINALGALEVATGGMPNPAISDFNIAIGSDAGSHLQSGSQNIYLGYTGFSRPLYNEHRVMRLGEFQQRTFIAGILNVAPPGSLVPVMINSEGQLGTLSSSARYKRDIEPMGTHSERLFQLRPVTFRYKQDEQGERQYGLIAEEVAKVYPELVVRNTKGEVESVLYHELTPMLLNELQHQHSELETMKSENEQLRERLERLEALARPR
jgi:Chaperone of endosialidase